MAYHNNDTDWAKNPPFTIVDVYGVVGGDPIPSGKFKSGTIGPLYCPICQTRQRDKMKMYLYTRDNSNSFHCFRCGETGGMLKLYQKTLGAQDNKSAFREICSALGIDTENREAYEEKKKAAAEKVKKIEEATPKLADIKPIEVRDKTYNALLDRMQLSPEHEKALEKRGLTAEHIISRKYRSHSVLAQGVAICNDLQVKGLSLIGCAGFYRNDKGDVDFKQMPKGILIPVRDREDRISGFQLRQDKSDGGNKYIWLTSVGLKDGTAATISVHYAVYRDANGKPILPNGCIFITEGPLKADVAHDVAGFPLLAVTGVQAQGPLPEELEWLKTNCGLTTVYNAFDMDRQTKPEVAKAMQKLKETVLSLGLKFVDSMWDSRYKGIDDYAIARKRGEI